MIIAVTYENGEVFQHFGHTPAFKLYTVENDAVTAEKIVPTGECGHGALAGFLKENGAEIMICGGIGGGAQMALAEAGIRLYGGVQGSADEAVKALLDGSLGYDPCVHCDHHEHGGGCGEHSCAPHSCGK